MTDRPILFSGPMVRALLEGRKIMTRRVLKPVNGLTLGDLQDEGEREGSMIRCARHQVQEPPYAPGDRLWVRETWRPHYLGDGVWNLDVSYAADGQRRTIMDGEFGDNDWSWPKAADRGNVSPLFMPRWASRLTLTVTDVRVQRLRDISEDDAVAEGIERMKSGRGYYDHTVSKGAVRAGIWHHKATEAFEVLWDSLNAKRGFGWEANPWVCAVTFEAHQRNIDQMPKGAGARGSS